MTHRQGKIEWLASALLGALLVSAVTTQAQELYRWVDEKGAVHFTDNFPSIPERYRKKAERRRLPPTSPPFPTPRQSEAASSRLFSQSGRFVVPFSRKGNAIIVRGSVNGGSTVEFILDTGATGTVIPRALAPQLGIDPNRGIPISVATAGGVVSMPLVQIDSLDVGGAVVGDLDVTLQDLPGHGTVGLLGMDFLSDFRMNIDHARNQVILEHQGGLDGGHSPQWWQQKFRLFHSIKRQIEQVLSKPASPQQREWAETQLRVIEERINDLEIKASRAAIPRESRQ